MSSTKSPVALRDLGSTLFRLDAAFVNGYRSQRPPFGLVSGPNRVGEIVSLRTYHRRRADGSLEMWSDVCERVVNGTYRMQQDHVIKHQLGWNADQAQRSAQEMFDRMWNMKFLPPGRGLWAMGTDITDTRKMYAALNNCGFVSTANIVDDVAKPFEFMMDMSMLGVGVGFDTAGANKLRVYAPFASPESAQEPADKALVDNYAFPVWPDSPDTFDVLTITDDREGWGLSLRTLVDSYLRPGNRVIRFNYHKIRQKNLLIKGFGGKSSGPIPLYMMHEGIRKVLDGYAASGKLLDSRAIVDIMNLVGACVVAGNVRRSAEISFGEPDDEQFINLKNPCYGLDPQFRDAYRLRLRNLQREYVWPLLPKHFEDMNIPADQLEKALDIATRLSNHGWVSNNSIFGKLGMDYSAIAEAIRENGEPGVAWLENMRAYSRMGDPPDNKDHRVAGGNPCLEQSLESYELCCLVETFPTRHETREDYLRTLKFAYLYAKTVTLGASHWPETNRVMTRNRRIGCSVSGIAQMVEKQGLHTLINWMRAGYEVIDHWDRVYSEWLGIPLSIKKTSVKPSGTVSKLVGASPGVHFPMDIYSIIRVSFAKTSPMVEDLVRAGYKVEDSVYDKTGNTVVVEFPTYFGDEIRTESQVPLWEQVSLAAQMQRHWADNQVSFTGKFDPKTEGGQIQAILEHFQHALKGISLLPKLEEGAYLQMPNESITKDEYHRLVAGLKPIEWTSLESAREFEGTGEKFCNNDSCDMTAHANGGAPA